KDIFGATITYSSSDEEIINPETGAVSTAKGGYYTLTAAISYEDSNVQRVFMPVIGNLAAGKAVSAMGAVGAGGTTTDMITDSSLDTAYLTRSATYSLIVDLGAEEALSQIVLHEAKNATGAVSGFELQLSTDGTNYTSVSNGTSIGEKLEINFLPGYARYIQLDVTGTTGGNTGLAELVAFYLPDDAQKAQADLDSVTVDTFTASGAALPAVGAFGSEITYVCDDAGVTFVRNDDQYIVTFAEPAATKSVIITATAKNGAESVTKQLRTALQGKQTVQTTISGGGGGGGGGAFNVSFSAADSTKPSEQTQGTGTVKTKDEIIREELAGHWGREEIQSLIDRGIVTGDDAGLHLAENITRAEFTALMVRAMGYEIIPFNNAFIDVSAADWYADIMQTGSAQGIIRGYDGYGNPRAAITREEAAVMIVNALGSESAAVSTFTDRADISLWALESVDKAAGLGLVNGYEDGRFAPKNAIRRDEAMVMIYRMFMKLPDMNGAN
ncbi:MAG: S-layer homology domain-containing protein, partial [Clostridia bacterium]